MVEFEYERSAEHAQRDHAAAARAHQSLGRRLQIEVLHRTVLAGSGSKFDDPRDIFRRRGGQPSYGQQRQLVAGVGYGRYLAVVERLSLDTDFKLVDRTAVDELHRIVLQLEERYVRLLADEAVTALGTQRGGIIATQNQRRIAQIDIAARRE